MNRQKLNYLSAVSFLRAYLKGVNTHTGEVFDFNSSSNEKLKEAISIVVNPTLDDLKMMMNHLCGFPFRRGFAWSQREEDEVIRDFESGIHFRDIAKAQKRSITAIMQRLKEKGLISRNVKLPERKNMKSFSIYYS